jgi:peptidyl-prolyl cis-trans isomerase NIMA-interacting 1
MTPRWKDETMRCMRTSHRFALLFGLSAACGGAPAAETPGRDAAPPSGARSCLDVANVQRERRTDEPRTVHVKHVLVKHKDTKNPREGVTRSREEACARAMKARDAVIAGADFDAVVSEYSDEAGAATRAGELGELTRAELQPPFADAAFLLDLNQMSDVVETDFGFHLIFRVP